MCLLDSCLFLVHDNKCVYDTGVSVYILTKHYLLQHGSSAASRPTLEASVS